MRRGGREHCAVTADEHSSVGRLLAHLNRHRCVQRIAWGVLGGPVKHDRTALKDDKSVTEVKCEVEELFDQNNGHIPSRA